MQHRMISLVGLLGYSALAWSAVQRPALPPPGEDSALFVGQSAAAFFDQRKQDASCREELNQARASYSQSADKAAMTRLLSLMERCGDCATHPVQRRVIAGGGRTEVWYVSDGSCLGPGTQYAQAVESLRQVAKYAKRNGGFGPMLEFLPVEITTGKSLEGVERIETFFFHAFVALRGVELLGVSVAYTQVFRIDWEELQEDGHRAVVVRYQGVKPPRGFQAPEVYEGDMLVQPIALPKVIAQWYINSKGYIRYYSAGDFVTNVKFGEEVGRRMLQEVLLTMHERMQ